MIGYIKYYFYPIKIIIYSNISIKKNNFLNFFLYRFDKSIIIHLRTIIK